MRRRLIDSFNYAVKGIIYTLSTQRNMRVHVLSAFIILCLTLYFDFSEIELLILFFTITLVIVAEMINTSIEKTIDMITEEYHPLAEISKNVAAGAVLVASVNAIVVGYILFFDKINPYTKSVILKIKHMPIHLTFISIFIVIIVTIVIKTIAHSGTPFSGGIVSGHTALAFSTATAITFISKETLVTTLSFFIAVLVGQSRIEGKIHSIYQTLAGALLGSLITIMIFQIIG